MENTNKITPEIILNAYANGYFPMADSANSKDVYWYSPTMRGQLSIDKLHVPKSTIRYIKKDLLYTKANSAFEDVIVACANRKETWINSTIINWFLELHRLGFAHSVEVFNRNSKKLVGGIYGIAIGGAFFGESMFSRESNASKVALVYLVSYLHSRCYIL